MSHIQRLKGFCFEQIREKKKCDLRESLRTGRKMMNYGYRTAKITRTMGVAYTMTH